MNNKCPICGGDKCKKQKHPYNIGEVIYDCQIAWQPIPGPQSAFCESDVFEVLFGGSLGSGKMSSLDSKILTPFGWTRMGDIKLGQQIMNPDGSVQRVIGVHPQGEMDMYKATFIDGATLEVGLDHLWAAKKTQSNIKADRRYYPFKEENKTKFKRWTTRQLLDFFNKKKKLPKDSWAKKQNILIPLTEPLSFTRTYKARNFIIEPYFLGVLLGDGSISGKNITITSLDEEIIKDIKKFGYKINLRGDFKTWGVNDNKDLINKLKHFNLFGHTAKDKFIPDYYKWASIEERIELLQGLMDTDGYVDTEGHLQYTTISKQLALDIQHIIWSIGGKATITSKIPTFTYKGEKRKGQRAYTLYISTRRNEDLVRLKRKKDRVVGKKYNGGLGELHRRMTSIEYVGKKEAQCITVDNLNGLYIADDFIVTHNSEVLLCEGLRQCNHPNYRAIIFRKTTPQLTELIDRAYQIFPKAFPGATFNISKSVWTFPSNAKYYLSHLEDEKAVRSHEGKEFNYIAFDEITHFSLDHFLYLFTRCRTKHKDIKCYIRASGMPRGPGIGWVKERFINLGGFKRYVDPDTGLDRMFIPATIEDNTILMENDPNYIARIKASLSPRMFKALRYGDWSVSEGAEFEELDEKVHKIPRFTPPKGSFVFRAMDWGYTSPYCVLWFYEDFDGRLIIFRELYGWGGRANSGSKTNARDAAREILEMEKDLDVVYGVADTQIWTRIGAVDKDREIASIIENFESEGVYFDKSIKDPVAGTAEIHNRLRVDEDTGKPWLYITEDCKHFWRTMPMLQTDEKKSGRYDTKGEDHVADALYYGLLSRPIRRDLLIPEIRGETEASKADF